jgi:hypothetical protein
LAQAEQRSCEIESRSSAGPGVGQLISGSRARHRHMVIISIVDPELDLGEALLG